MPSFKKASRLATIQPSATIAITQLARDLRAAGRDILSLSIGEPDFDTPDNVKAAAVSAIKRGETKYPPVPGLPELRAAVAKKFLRENGIRYELDEVIVGAGGKQIIAMALLATLDPGDEVIIPAPYWVSYPQLTVLSGAVPVIVTAGVEAGFKMSPAALEAAITPRTRWLILNSPGNPSGAVYTEAELTALARVLAAHENVWILSDDIYEHLVYGGLQFRTMASVAPELWGRTLTMNGVSKAYAMTGWRIGYAGGPKNIIKAMSLLQSQLTGGASRPSQWAAAAALDGPQQVLDERRSVFDSRRKLVVNSLNSIGGMECLLPHGAFYAFPRCQSFFGRSTPKGRLIQDDEDFCMELLEDAGVATVQGSAFGFAGHVRVSYAASENTIMEACQRIARFCQSLA